jgi:hypothetical protein
MRKREGGGERGRERYVVYGCLFLFLKRNTGALAPFSYLAFI